MLFCRISAHFVRESIIMYRVGAVYKFLLFCPLSPCQTIEGA